MMTRGTEMGDRRMVVLGVHVLVVLALLLAIAAQSARLPAAARADTPKRTGLIAFQQCAGGAPPCNIATIDPSGTIQQLTNVSGSSNEAYDPVWAPDGSHIAYGRYSDGTWSIWVMSASGSNQQQLYACPKDCYPDTWSQDGSMVSVGLYRSSTYHEQVQTLVELHLSGLSVTGSQTLLSGDDICTEGAHIYSWPTVSPDGAKIAYAETTPVDGNPVCATAIAKVMVANVDGSNPSTIATSPLMCGPGEPYTGIRWAPDGSRITYGTSLALLAPEVPCYGTNATTTTTVASADGSSSSSISQPGGCSQGRVLGWSPDSEHLLWLIDPTCPFALWVSNADGSNAYQLVTGAQVGLGQAAWQPTSAPKIASMTFGTPVIRDHNANGQPLITDFQPSDCAADGLPSNANWEDCNRTSGGTLQPDGTTEKNWPVIIPENSPLTIPDARFALPAGRTITDATVWTIVQFPGHPAPLTLRADNVSSNPGSSVLDVTTLTPSVDDTVPAVVSAYPSVSIRWVLEEGSDQATVSPSGVTFSGTTTEMGTATAPVYVTNAPAVSPSVYGRDSDPNGTRYLTVVDLGTQAAQGAGGLFGSDTARVVDDVWQSFQSLTLYPRTLDPVSGTVSQDTSRPFTYWPPNWSVVKFVSNNYPNICSGLADLLQNTVGRCGVFASLFAYVLGAQGIAASTNQVSSFPGFPRPPGTARSCGAGFTDITQCTYMMIGPLAWTFGTPLFHSLDPFYPYEDLFHLGAGVAIPLPIQEAQYDSGMGGIGQGHVHNPDALFVYGDHDVVQVNGQIYDPSYGNGPFPDILHWARTSLAGWAILSPNPCTALCTFKVHKGL